MPPPASIGKLSESQDQLLQSVLQLQDAQREYLNEYANTYDENERKKIMDKMKKNEALRTNLLDSSSNVNVVAKTISYTEDVEKKNLELLVQFAETELADIKDRMDVAQRNHAGKQRMIELNTYYGKRFMAQAGVMKIFIYMCIPVLILAVLANMGLLPNYIAGFIIIVIVVIGIVYIYSAVNDINRRDNVNFDEYEWEFDPSRVGTIVNPNYGSADATGTNGIGCYNGNCCGGSTKWNPATLQCMNQ